MIKQLILSLTVMILLSSLITTAQDDPQMFPTDIVTEIQQKWTI